MKFAAVVCLIFALFGLALGLKNGENKDMERLGTG